MSTEGRVLSIRTASGATLRCPVISIARTANPAAWLLVVAPPDWLDAGSYACTVHNGERRTEATFGVIDYIVGPAHACIHAKGVLRLPGR